jgi:hypothetical protein
MIPSEGPYLKANVERLRGFVLTYSTPSILYLPFCVRILDKVCKMFLGAKRN